MDTDEDIPSEPELPPGFRWVSAGRVAPAVGRLWEGSFLSFDV